VGQDVILRGGWQPPLFGCARRPGRRIDNPPQVNNLPHKAADNLPHNFRRRIILCLESQSHLSFNVVKAQSASTSPAIQNRAIIFDSAHPSASK